MYAYTCETLHAVSFLCRIQAVLLVLCYTCSSGVYLFCAVLRTCLLSLGVIFFLSTGVIDLLILNYWTLFILHTHVNELLWL